MAQISISVIDNASPMLRGAIKQMSDYKRPLTASGMYMFKETVRQFETEGTHAGMPWKPLAKSTLKQRRGRMAKILQDTRRLLSSVTSKSSGSVWNLSDTTLEMGTNVEYAVIHQYGGTINRTVKAGSAILSRRGDKGSFRFTKQNAQTMSSIRKGKKQFRYVDWMGGGSYSINIPARPFLVVTERNKQEISRIFERYATGCFKK